MVYTMIGYDAFEVYCIAIDRKSHLKLLQYRYVFCKCQMLMLRFEDHHHLYRSLLPGYINLEDHIKATYNYA